MKLLTQKEVDDLPDGTHVWIIWSGGNGPHRYKLRNFYGEKYTVHNGEILHPVDHVGAAPLTQVWKEKQCP